MTGAAPSARRPLPPVVWKLLVSGLLLAGLLWRADPDRLLDTLRALPLTVFLGSLLLYGSGYTLSALRWQRLLAAEGVHLGLRRLILLYFQGAFFNLFLPSLIGGDIFRGYAIHKITRGHDAALASILVDRLSGYAALMGMALAALALHRDAQDPQVTGMIVAVTLLFVALVVTLQNPRAAALASRLLGRLGLARYRPKLEGMVASLQRYRGHRMALAQAFALSVVLQSVIIVVYYLIGESLGIGVPLGYFFLYVPLITTLAMLPISVAGLGVREGGVVYFFAKVGVDGGTALGMSLIWFALSASVSSLGGLALLLDLHLRKRAAE